MRTALILFPFVLLLSSCGDKKNETEKNDPPVTDTVKQVRKNKDELGLLLPKELLGYKPRKAPEGLDMVMKNAKFSFSILTYFKDNDSICVELHDYLEGQPAYESYADMWWFSKKQADNATIKAGPLDMGAGIDAWEVDHRDEKRTTIYLGVRDRYYLIFEAYNKPDLRFIEAVVKQFDFAPLLHGK